jgi:hypothetical protein
MEEYYKKILLIYLLISLGFFIFYDHLLNTQINIFRKIEEKTPTETVIKKFIKSNNFYNLIIKFLVIITPVLFFMGLVSGLWSQVLMAMFLFLMMILFCMNIFNQNI